MNLSQFKSAILFKNQNLANTPMPLVIKQLSDYTDTHSANAYVEASALEFYLLNQAFGLLTINVDAKAELTLEQEKLARLYLMSASESSARLYYYMLMIITRESRHLHTSETFYKKLALNHGADMASFIRNLRGAGSDGAISLLKGSDTTLANVTLGTYTACITDVFNNGSFSGGYGGKPWGHIAETLRKMVHGEISIEIMNDTAWTLAHNNGPMFNKGMLYHGFNAAMVFKILDVQRAGMIPQLIAEGSLGKYAKSTVMKAFNTVKQVFPESVAGYVDWFKVEALGSKHTYPTEKAAQKSKYGKTNVQSAPLQTESKKFWVNESEYAVAKEYKRVA